jgi:hypothetical protein
MAITNPIHEGVKVKRGIITEVKKMVRDGYYRKDFNSQMTALCMLSRKICEIHGVERCKVIKGTVLGAYAAYAPGRKTIYIRESVSGSHISIVSFLHELRHHLQYSDVKMTRGYNKEQDAHGWSIRVFSKVCPRMFEEAVRSGNIAALVMREDGRIQNNTGNPQIMVD